VSAELLLTIFQPNTALHDGAAIIRGDRIVAAACIMPLAETSRVRRGLGLRHRAAVGITEQSDALATIVSEETGTISLARYGRLVSNLDESRLRELLRSSYRRQWSGNFSRRADRQ
jgi:diadenylate cyclase